MQDYDVAKTIKLLFMLVGYHMLVKANLLS